MAKFLPIKATPNTKSGFGLIELLVSISIMVLVTSVVIFRHSAFNGASLLRSQAWDVALGIREIQLTAVSASKAGSALDFRQVYGAHFDIGLTGNRQGYVVFRDLSPVNYYYNSTDELLGWQGRLDRRFEIAEIYSFTGSPVGVPQDNLSITFERPNYVARFRVDNNPFDLNADRIEITVRVRGTTDLANRRIIEITRTGQISVKSN